MARHDYSNDDDFYTQGFGQPGVVSVWLGMSAESSDSATDVLQDLCGVGYYNLDDQESNSARPSLASIEQLLVAISYAASFRAEALARAREMRIDQARWIVVQFDFAYSPAMVRRPVSADPIFLGVFQYCTE